MTNPLSSSVSRRAVLGVAAACAAAPSMALAQVASRPVRIVVGATPGGSIDIGARVIAAALTEELKTTVIVENKPGGSGIIANEFVSKSEPDGHTLLVSTSSSVVIVPQAMPNARFNPLTDLVPINLMSTSPLAIAVNPKLDVKRLSDLIALAKTRQVTMALPLVGSLSHVVTELAAKAGGTQFQNVPYRGAAPAIADTIAGHTDATVSDAGVLFPFHRDGRLRLVMVTSDKRLTDFPDVPTGLEDYPGMNMTNWIGVFGPPKMPQVVVDRLNAALRKVVASPSVREQFAKSSVTAVALDGPPAFQSFVAGEYVRYGRLLRERGITITN